ncbi:DNA primase [bacterium]|nr:DNA primase [bacterium]
MQHSSNEYTIPKNLIDEVRDKTDIVQIISEHGIPLKRTGKNYTAPCPFHDEQNPSFSVSPEKQFFYCFGCQAGGTVFQFLQKFDGLTFIESVKTLAERAGITLPGQTQSSRAQSSISVLKELNQFALDYFHKQLLNPKIGNRALAYLKNRGITSKTIMTFKLGYALPSFSDFLKAGARAGFSQQVMLDGGFIKSKDGKPYDGFRDRAMFPIFSDYGDPVGFGGRALDDDNHPKYLNSPETLLYHKGKVLYNLNLAIQALRLHSREQKSRQIILVEGYFDAIIPYQFGVENIVASSGTAFTEDHARLLKRYADETVIMYDGDTAGLNATQRGLDLLVKQGLRVKIALLSKDSDPDNFIRAQGVDAFKNLVATAIDFIDFQIRMVCRQKKFRSIEAKVQAAKELCSTLSNVKELVALNEYVKRTSIELEIDESILWQELRKLGVVTNKPSKTLIKHSTREKPRESLERQLLECLLQRPNLISQAASRLSDKDFSNDNYSKIAAILWQKSINGGNIRVQDLISDCNDEKLRGMISSLFLQSRNPPNLEATLNGCIRKLKRSITYELMRSRIISGSAEGNDLTLLKEGLAEFSISKKTELK